MNKVEFSINEIDENLYKKMIGNSIKNEDINKVDINNLRYLRVSHIGFDEETHVGELVVNKEVAEDIIEIFKELYEKSYKIEKIKLIDEYSGDDNLSMADNNSSSFNYRTIPGKEKLSNHATGRAIDINPLYNPYIVNGKILPPNGEKYADRSLPDDRYIRKNDFVYNTFIKYGWSWGGEWLHAKDYQHFEKI